MSESKKKSGTVPRRAVYFELCDLPGKEVLLTGSFDDWQERRRMNDKNNDGTYRCRMLLAPGVYQYKFLIDGEWRVDPQNPNFQPNEFGSLNSVLEVTPK